MRRVVVGATRPQRPFAPTGGPSRQGLGLAPPPCLQDHLQAVPADGADWVVATPPFDRAQTVVERTLALLAPPRGCFDRHGRARAATHFRCPRGNALSGGVAPRPRADEEATRGRGIWGRRASGFLMPTEEVLKEWTSALYKRPRVLRVGAGRNAQASSGADAQTRAASRGHRPFAASRGAARHGTSRASAALLPAATASPPFDRAQTASRLRLWRSRARNG